jgi:hypothetical protein
MSRMMSKNPFFLVLQFFGGAGCLFLVIGLFFWPLLIVAFPLFIVGGIGQWLVIFFDKAPRFKCRNCGFIKTKEKEAKAAKE